MVFRSSSFTLMAIMMEFCSDLPKTSLISLLRRCRGSLERLWLDSLDVKGMQEFNSSSPHEEAALSFTKLTDLGLKKNEATSPMSYFSQFDYPVLKTLTLDHASSHLFEKFEHYDHNLGRRVIFEGEKRREDVS